MGTTINRNLKRTNRNINFREIDNEVAIGLYEKYGFTKKDSFEYKIEETTYREFRMLKQSW